MRASILLLLSVYSFLSLSQSQKTATAAQAARDTIKKFMEAAHIPGVAVTVMIDGKVAFSEGFGYADLEQHVAVTPGNTKFRIGSISKSITAAAMARLVELNKIVLDSSIYYYLPSYPRKRYRPTVRQVAGHIGGVRHYKGNEWLSSAPYPTVAAGLTMFQDDSLIYEPGTRYQYTSHGFNLLSAVLEKASGTEFLSLVKREVLQPLKLQNTCPDKNDSIIAYRGRFYERDGDHWANAPYVDNSYKWAGGGFVSTSEDVARFGSAFLHARYLKPETIALFTTPQRLSDGSLTSYGMGFFSGKDASGRAYFGHSGGSVGGTCDMVIYPKEKVVVAILTNLSNARLDNISRRIAGVFIKP